MTEEPRPKFTQVAQGNHTKGYRGAIIRDYAGPDEKIVARCRHHHPTTGEARACIGGSWFHARGLDGLVVSNPDGELGPADEDTINRAIDEGP